MLPKNRRPTPPGEILEYEYLEPLGMSLRQLADHTGLSAGYMNELIKGGVSLTFDTAFRLGRFFNTSPEFWLNLQRHVDMWDTLRAHGHEYEKIHPFIQNMPIAGRSANSDSNAI